MSVRTIIEINHDYLNTLLEHPGYMAHLLHVLRGTTVAGELNKGETPSPVSGIRVLAQRHHSETLKLEVK